MAKKQNKETSAKKTNCILDNEIIAEPSLRETTFEAKDENNLKSTPPEVLTFDNIVEPISMEQLSEQFIEAIAENLTFKVNETKFKDKYFQRLMLKAIRDIAKLPAIKIAIEAAVDKYGKEELLNELQEIVDLMLLPSYKEDVWGLKTTKQIANREVNKYRKNLIAELTGFTSTCNNCGEQTWVNFCKIFVAIIYLLED